MAHIEFTAGGNDFIANIGEKGATIYDGEREILGVIPGIVTEKDIQTWVDGYAKGWSAGEKKGHVIGVVTGKAEFRNQLLNILGIGDRLRGVEYGVHKIGSILYEHEGIDKEEISDIANIGGF